MRPLLLVALVLAACGSAAVTANPPVDVRITNANDFSLHELAIQVGGSVKWTNDSAVNHTVTFTDALRIPADNGTFNQKVDLGGSVSRTFAKSGTYFFFCMIHPGMQGQVTVGGP